MPVQSIKGVTLVGGGELARTDLETALSYAPTLVAADGGANNLMEWGHMPDRVIGDIDSLDTVWHSQLGNRIERIAEQDSTDFDKCLSRISAPFILALGFDGARLDHTLAAMSTLTRHRSARILMKAAADICFLAPPVLELDLPEGARVSLFPMAPVSGRSEGLYWPIDGLQFAPHDVIGTSNRATGGRVRLQFARPGMLVLLERAYLAPVIAAVQAVPDWG